MDSVDSHKKRACPHYPQPYDDGDDAPLLWVGALGTLPEEDHNKHSLKWYSFLGELPGVQARAIVAEGRERAEIGEASADSSFLSAASAILLCGARATMEEVWGSLAKHQPCCLNAGLGKMIFTGCR